VVVKVGASVGQEDGLPGQARVPRQFLDPVVGIQTSPIAEGLIGQHITFGEWTGEEIHINPKKAMVERSYDDGPYNLIQAVDIWGHNTRTEKEKEEDVPDNAFGRTR